MKIGRPTEYTDDMILKLQKAMNEGLSVERFCRQEQISKQAFYEWVKKHESFGYAFEVGKVNCEAFWEKWLTENFENKNVREGLVKLFMANRFGWRSEKNLEEKTNRIEEELKQFRELMHQCTKK